MTDKERLDFHMAFFALTWEYDCCSDFWWRVDDGKVRFLANCGDFFDWGSSDCEEVGPEDLPAMEQAMKDACAAYEPDKPRSISGGSLYGTQLWIARKRKCRPQGACYKGWEPAIAALFDACGPHRPTGIGNPHPNDPARK